MEEQKKYRLRDVHPLVYLVSGMVLISLGAVMGAANEIEQILILDLISGGLSTFGFFCLIIMLPVTTCIRIMRWDKRRQ
jgi:hypothetical protein